MLAKLMISYDWTETIFANKHSVFGNTKLHKGHVSLQYVTDSLPKCVAKRGETCIYLVYEQKLICHAAVLIWDVKSWGSLSTRYNKSPRLSVYCIYITKRSAFCVSAHKAS